MSVLLRAALVIGVLSYLALMRNGADPAAEARRLTGSLPSAATVLPAALDAVPPETRERAAKSVLARGLMAELSRRAPGLDRYPGGGRPAADLARRRGALAARFRISPVFAGAAPRGSETVCSVAILDCFAARKDAGVRALTAFC